MTDPIADMLTRIRNALARKKKEVVLPFSKIKFEIANLLKKEGILSKVEKETCRLPVRKSKGGKNIFPKLKITPRYNSKGEPVTRGLKRISKPGLRIYVSRNNIPRPLSGYGLAIISTSQGLMTDREARQRRLGGEVICEVY